MPRMEPSIDGNLEGDVLTELRSARLNAIE